jgi:hypothetical protein
MGGQHLNQPIVGMAATATGGGYWLVASDGGIFAFGDAPYLGSTGNLHLNAPIVAMATTPTGGGYWLAGADGGVFTFGSAPFYGSAATAHLAAPIVGMAATYTLGSYWLVGADGGVFGFHTSIYHGGMSGTHLNGPMVGIAVRPVRPQPFHIMGDLADPLYPGAGPQKLDLVLVNPNRLPLTLTGGITVTFAGTVPGCSLSNFKVTHGMTAGSVVMPARSSETLTQLGVPQTQWPLVSMLTTTTTQNACQGASLTLKYQGQATEHRGP